MDGTTVVAEKLSEFEALTAKTADPLRLRTPTHHRSDQDLLLLLATREMARESVLLRGNVSSSHIIDRLHVKRVEAYRRATTL
jgi:hypothetical protein